MYYDEVLFIAAPDITIPPESVNTIVGLSVALDCVVTGLPLPTVIWFKDSIQLSECGFPPCVDNGGIFIQSASVTDSGRYVCVASNSEGRALSEAIVTVQPSTSRLLLYQLLCVMIIVM